MFGFLLAHYLVADPPPQNLLGRWRSVETSKGGIGAMLTFQSNGVVDFSPGAVVEMNHRIEGSQLILPPATITGPEQRQQMEFHGEHQLRLITIAGGQRATLVLTRKGRVHDAANPILGEWVGSQEMEGRRMDAHYLFYPAGKGLFLSLGGRSWIVTHVCPLGLRHQYPRSSSLRCLSGSGFFSRLPTDPLETTNQYRHRLSPFFPASTGIGSPG
jgi:hypothetical protein